MRNDSETRTDTRNTVGILTPNERTKLSGVTMISLPAILRWERGEGVTSRTRETLMSAAKKMGFPTPPATPKKRMAT